MRDLLGMRRAFVASVICMAKWTVTSLSGIGVILSWFLMNTLRLRTFVHLDDLRAFRYTVLLYCDNFSTFRSLLTALIFFKCEYITHASIVHNHANCPWILHSEHYDFLITHQLHCVIAFGSMSSNFRSCFCGPAFSGISSFLVPHFQLLHFQSTLQ